jgi:hypothetical protein
MNLIDNMIASLLVIMFVSVALTANLKTAHIAAHSQKSFNKILGEYFQQKTCTTISQYQSSCKNDKATSIQFNITVRSLDVSQK